MSDLGWKAEMWLTIDDDCEFSWEFDGDELLYVDLGTAEHVMRVNFSYQALANFAGFLADMRDEFAMHVAADNERRRQQALEIGYPWLKDTPDNHMVYRQEGGIRIWSRVNGTAWQQAEDAYALFLARERGELPMRGGWYAKPNAVTGVADEKEAQS